MPIGTLIADAFDRIQELFGPEEREWTEDGAVRRADIAAALIALGAKMAKADGQVTPDEIAAFSDVFQASKEEQSTVARLFNMFRTTTLGFEAYADRIARRWRAHPAVLEDVLDGLFHIAKADGVITGDELTYLRTVAERFGFSEREFRRAHAAHDPLNARDPYLILGVDPDIDDDGLKRAYRRAAAQNHPDALIARGAPEELRKLAEEKMAAINEAYDEIVKERGLVTASD